jgi:hypothetical protein
MSVTAGRQSHRFLGEKYDGIPPGLDGSNRDEERDRHFLGVLEACRQADHCLAAHVAPTPDVS